MTRLLSLHLIFVFSGIHCNDNSDENNTKYNSALKEPISTPDDFFRIEDGKDVLQSLVRLFTDAEYRDGRNKALKTMTPSKDLLRPRILDDDILDMADAMLPDPPKISKIHMHHIFPPSIIRPLQRVIVQKIIHKIQHPPHKKYKKMLRRKLRIGTAALGLGLGLKELKELKSNPMTAHYKVSGLVDLSGQKYNKEGYGDHGEHGDYDRYKDNEHHERYRRSATFPVEESGYVKDFGLIPSKKHHWPFHESKEEIYEKWNKFPAPGHVDPFHHKIKYLHRSFHELQPELLHLVKDVEETVHGVKRKHVVSSGHFDHGLENPLVLAGQLVKLADSLIPSIRIRIPFLEYLKHLFHEKSKPKVVYVKQKPKVKYVGVPYMDEALPMPEPPPKPGLEVNILPQPEAMNINVMPVPESEPEYQYQRTEEKSPQIDSKNYEMIKNLNQDLDHSIDHSLPDPSTQPQHRYTQMFDQAAQVYRDRGRARARA